MDPSTRRPLGASGLEVSVASYGGGSLGNFFRRMSNAEAAAILEAAWAGGIRYFDTAPVYGRGRSERRLGAFLGELPRDEFIVSTKVGRIMEPARGAVEEDGIFLDPAPFNVVYDYTYDGIMRSHEHSLQRLGLDRVDILYVHDIDQMIHGEEHAARLRDLREGGIRALEELRGAQVISAYGLGVNQVETCLQCLDYAAPDAFLLAGRFTLLEQRAALPLLDKCLHREVSIVAGGVFNSGILATGPVPGAHYNYGEASGEVCEVVARMQALCGEYGVELATAALQFPLSHPAVASVLLGVGTMSSLQRNLDGLRAQVPTQLWDALAELGMATPEAIGN
ncbi:aldo/keto reductase [Mangrovimicrobium sediminis]|uniref:Aldo/keto reductase n=1 Tax=Mangrovimicrobium sediminis TaxID=2562682 RepID=A0A4Z0M033_9GAMM|nr:aldo/keto reductase [Haliea sp. SAOS-164]TGD73022.1 aldo/keto reductase [Haliea sp. SAOS-164]